MLHFPFLCGIHLVDQVAVQFKKCIQSFLRNDLLGKCLVRSIVDPCIETVNSIGFLQGCLLFCFSNFSFHGKNNLLLLLSGQQQGRRWQIIIPCNLSCFSHIVEKAEHLVIVLLRNRIILVVMATGTSHRKGHECITHGIGAVHHIFGLVFQFNDSTFHVLLVVPVEGSGDQHVTGWVGQQVSSQLLVDERIVRHVDVEGIDDPIPVGRHVALPVNGIAMGICKPCKVQPFGCHSLAIML